MKRSRGRKKQGRETPRFHSAFTRLGESHPGFIENFPILDASYRVVRGMVHAGRISSREFLVCRNNYDTSRENDPVSRRGEIIFRRGGRGEGEKEKKKKEKKGTSLDNDSTLSVDRLVVLLW